MKKIISVIMALLLVGYISFSVSASSTISIGFKPNLTTVYPLQQFEVMVTAANATGKNISAFNMDVDFDSARFAYISMTSIAMDSSEIIVNPTKSGKITLVYVDNELTSPISKNAINLFKLVFTAKASVAAGASSFKASNYVFCDIDEIEIPADIKNGSLTIAKLMPPTKLSAASASYNSVKVSWAASAGAMGYTVYRGASSTGKYTYLGRTTATSYISGSLNTGTIYYYIVYSHRTKGTEIAVSAFSAPVSARPILSVPSSFTVARASSTSVKISYGAVAGASGYAIYRATSSTGTPSCLLSTTAVSYINKSLKTGKTYYYKVCAYRMVGKVKVYSAFSAVKSVKP